MTHEHTNDLVNESSPYLLQHAHNPVDWHPWSETALQKAEEEGKPGADGAPATPGGGSASHRAQPLKTR